MASHGKTIFVISLMIVPALQAMEQVMQGEDAVVCELRSRSTNEHSVVVVPIRISFEKDIAAEREKHREINEIHQARLMMNHQYAQAAKTCCMFTCLASVFGLSGWLWHDLSETVAHVSHNVTQ